LKLYGSSRSPHVRKVLIAAYETNTIGSITLVPVVVSALTTNEAMLAVNPLGQIPTLVRDDGQPPLYDSAVICRYLDLVLGKGTLFPRDIEAELAMLRRLALGDGLIAALMSLLSERNRQQPDHSDRRIAALERKLPHIFAALDAEAAAMAEAPFDMAQISVVAALAYLDFRLASEGGWRDRFTGLARWFETVSRRPSVVATAYFDEQAAATAPAGRQ
jgi:glutathione S-transferase